jgi:competence protein ComEA
MGMVLAERVIAYRKSAGGFRSIDDLRRVKGIGAKKLDRLRPLVMVSGPATSSTSQSEKSPL